jgi:HAD superfamily phosphoserine phosphatase-like hydrolase
MNIFIFDFDGTITTNDTTDLILEMPHEDQIWQIEKEWTASKLTSYQCMKAQTSFLKGITIHEIHQHLQQHSTLDPSFTKLVHFLKAKNFYLLILSEGYDISLRFHNIQNYIEDIHCSKVITKHGKLTGELQVSNERLWNYNNKCLGCCICKVDFLLQLRKRFNITQSYAVGDGRSDECLFQYVDVSFSLNPKYKATHQVEDLSAVFQILRTKRER